MLNDEDKFFTLEDGRQLAFTEHGNLKGKPVFFFHGNPGCRLQRHPDETIVESLGVRIITPDRPGYGLSDCSRDRKLLDYSSDIEQLANHLGIDKFNIFGVSAGGPYTAAVAYGLPKRVESAAIVSGATPLDRKGAYEGMHAPWRAAFEMGKKMPAAMLKISMQMHYGMVKHNPDRAIKHLAHTVSKYDQEILNDPEIRDGIMKRQLEAMRRGVDGMVKEAKVLTSPWNFDVADIKAPVHLWYWEDDYSIPMQMGEYFSENIPNTFEHFYDGGGHLAIFEFWGEIIESLINTKVKQKKSFKTKIA